MTLTGTTNPDPSWAGNNCNERIFHIPQRTRNGASPSDSSVSYPGDLLVLPDCRGIIGVFYSLSQLGVNIISNKYN